MIKAPFPYFGGKSSVADVVWQRFGNPRNYVEPFYGSGAVHLGRPEWHFDKQNCTETINDYDGFVTNAWRSLAYSPEETAVYADSLPNENDLHARHIWLLEQRESLRHKLEGDPFWHDPQVAGWWIWGMSCWIGSGFCSGKGPWQSVEVDGSRQLLHLGKGGRGVNRKLLHLGNAGRGVNRQLLHLGNAGSLVDYFRAIQSRFNQTRVRIASGDWSRVCGPSVTHKHGLTGVFLDPPYGEEANRADLYRIDSHTLAAEVRAWCAENGDNELLRIALCGYDGEHNELEDLGWDVYDWSASGGYEGQGKERSGNRHRERIWFSPHCLSIEPTIKQLGLDIC